MENKKQIIELIDSFLLKKILDEQDIFFKSRKEYDEGKVSGLIFAEEAINDFKSYINDMNKE